MNKDEWLRDIDARQRNVVFPDTVQNEARFWRNLWRGNQKLTTAQLLGLFLLLAMFAGPAIAIPLGIWRETPGVWWQKIIGLYGNWLIDVGIVVGLIAFLVHFDRKKTDRGRQR